MFLWYTCMCPLRRRPIGRQGPPQGLRHLPGHIAAARKLAGRKFVEGQNKYSASSSHTDFPSSKGENSILILPPPPPLSTSLTRHLSSSSLQPPKHFSPKSCINAVARYKNPSLNLASGVCLISSALRLFSLPFFPLSRAPTFAFGRVKGTTPTTALAAVAFVSDQDFSLRKTFHIINILPPPAPEVAL